jgi:hypothetical protein
LQPWDLEAVMEVASTSTTADERPSGVPRHPAAANVLISAFAGALGGIALGIVAGPIAMVIGGLLGAVGGAGVGDALGRIQEHRSLHDDQMDESIGVIDGNLGVAAWDAPPARIGAYSASSAGAISTTIDSAPVEGPFPAAD